MSNSINNSNEKVNLLSTIINDKKIHIKQLIYMKTYDYEFIKDTALIWQIQHLINY